MWYLIARNGVIPLDRLFDRESMLDRCNVDRLLEIPVPI